MDSYRIDEIVRRLLENIPPAVRSVQQDLEANFRTVLRASLGKLDLVTREEFDAQTKVLERTRAKADTLEARIAELERAFSGSAARTAPGNAGARSAPGAGPEP